MNKDVLIVLIRKDIRELEMMLEGLSENVLLPDSLLNLAVIKAENVVACLSQLKQQKAISEIQEKNDAISETTCCNDETNNDMPNLESESEHKTVLSLDEVEENEPIEENISSVVVAEQSDTDDILPESESCLTAVSEPAKSEPKETTETSPEYAYEKKEPCETSEPETDNSNIDTFVNNAFVKQESAAGSFLSAQKIDDIRFAINIADRFRFQRELFSGDGEKMSSTISDLNQQPSMEAAMNYIKDHFQWNEEQQSVKDFIRIINRRFL